MRNLARIAVICSTMVLAVAPLTADAARKPQELLQYIPADTPYLVALIRPLPDEFVDKVEPAIDESLAAYRNLMEIMAADAARKLAEQEGGEAQARRYDALMSELMALMSVRGLREAGIGRDALFALYGDGLLPVIRIALSDGEKFDAALERIEAASEMEFHVAAIDEMEYRYLDVDGKARLIVATPGDDAVITMVPSGYADERLARTLGFEMPRRSLAQTRDLRDIAREYGFTDHAISYFDTKRIAATFLGDPSGLNAELLALADYDVSQLDATCREEFAEMAAIVPRIVAGYTDVDEHSLETAMIVEMRDDIAAGLTTLPAAVPGLGQDPGGLLSFGFSLNPLALRGFYEARLDAMEEDPYECVHLAELQASTAQGREALQKPIPPVVYNFRGMLARIEDVSGLDMSGAKLPESLDAGFLLAMENAQDLVNAGALMSPQIAALNLLPDGEAKRLEWPELGELAAQAFAALTTRGLSIAVGEDAEREAEAMLAEDVAEPAPLISFSMDAKRYYEFVGASVMRAEEAGEEEPMSDEMRAAMRDLVQASGKIYDRLSMNVHLTERGIELGSRVTLAR
ncbi:MAG: hypothetical protein P8X98_16420 [Woeseiaceae bacterium]